EAELAALEPGRGAPSNTIRGDVEGSGTDFSKAARQVNDWARNGEDLDVARLKQLNEALEAEEDPGRAGKLRSELDAKDDWRAVGHGGKKPFWYAAAETVDGHLTDFMDWYKANHGSMNPVELAAKSY